MANGFESDFIAQGKKMKSLRARMHHNGKDAGAGTLEYLGIILFVGLIVVGLVLTATPIGSKIAEKLCEAFGTSCPAVAAVDEKAPPARACERQSSTVEGGVSAGVLFVNGERNRSVTTRELSDGTFIVEVVDDAGIGAELSAGELDVSLAVGEFDIGLGANAGVGMNLIGGNGEEYHFSSQQEADDFVAYVGRQTMADGFALVAAPPGLEPVFNWGGQGINWLWNKITGYDPPSSSNVSYYYGGVEGYGSANANGLIGGGSADARGETVLGMKVNHDTGDTTAYIDISGSLEADLHLGWSSSNANLGAGGSWRGDTSLILETTVDSDGNLTQISVIESGGTEYGENVRENLGITDAATHEGNATRTQIDIPVTDANRADMEDVIRTVTGNDHSPGEKFDRLTEAARTFHEHVQENGDVTYEQLSVDSSNILSIGLAGKLPGIGGVGIGVDSSTQQTEVVDAKYLTPDGWMTWDACFD